MLRKSDGPKMDIKLGDTVITKKPHPCGGSEWTVVRTGADLKLKCATCGRIVMLDRAEGERRIKKLIPREE